MSGHVNVWPDRDFLSQTRSVQRLCVAQDNYDGATINAEHFFSLLWFPLSLCYGRQRRMNPPINKRERKETKVFAQTVNL